MLTSYSANHRSQRTPRLRSVCILRGWRGAAAAERYAYAMKSTLFSLAILAFTVAVRADAQPPKDGWSGAVNGLRARLVLGERHTQSGEAIPEEGHTETKWVTNSIRGILV